ncbi:hypothetical protein CRE_28178 [Caenorhabditis remanei]|uniref:Uncharacterized protein n=1 Tax=Caenorhabditis remanei TaxID=31234 RepID=E3LMR0_CAERE|nr:hypothetical protein CRE_28178 [Caenorhabditis remanei]
MGRSKSKSNSRSISKWKKFFRGEKTSESRDDCVEQTTMNTTMSIPTTKSNDSITGGMNISRSKSITKRKSYNTREEVTRTIDEKGNDQHIAPSSKNQGEEKKKDKKEKDGVKSEEVPVKTKKKESKDEEQEASVFEVIQIILSLRMTFIQEVQGPAAPAQTGTHGIKNKMRWKIDVEGADVNGDQKMSEIMEKMSRLRRKSKMKKCKVLRANEKGVNDDDEEPNENSIIDSARVLQLVKLESLISKELLETDQEILRGYCRSGDQEDKAEGLIEKIVIGVLNAVVQKNEFIRQVSVPGQLRLFAVDEKKAKYAMMALLMARKDLLYVSWSKPNRDVENALDATWAGMTVKKVPGAAVQSPIL